MEIDRVRLITGPKQNKIFWFALEESVQVMHGKSQSEKDTNQFYQICLHRQSEIYSPWKCLYTVRKINSPSGDELHNFLGFFNLKILFEIKCIINHASFSWTISFQPKKLAI